MRCLLGVVPCGVVRFSPRWPRLCLLSLSLSLFLSPCCCCVHVYVCSSPCVDECYRLTHTALFFCPSFSNARGVSSAYSRRFLSCFVSFFFGPDKLVSDVFPCGVTVVLLLAPKSSRVSLHAARCVEQCWVDGAKSGAASAVPLPGVLRDAP